MPKLSPLLLVLLVGSNLTSVSLYAAEEGAEKTHKSGYDRKPEFSGPDSPKGQLEENDRVKEAAFRFPAFDGLFTNWNSFKQELDNQYGLKFGGHYSTMYQTNGDESYFSGNFRLTTTWTVLGKDTATPGFISLIADNRHSYGDYDAPGNFGNFGQYGITATQFGDFDGNFKILTLAWNHKFSEDSGYVIGSYDPNDYMNVQGYVSPQTSFSNMSILLETSVNLPDTSWGVAAGHWFNDSWYVQGGINDANGFGGDGNEWFAGGAEFFKWTHLGWSPSKDDRYYKNFHIAAWHADERDERISDNFRGQEEVWGMSAAFNWTFNQQFMPFVKAGFSEGDHTFFNNTFAAGMMYKFMSSSDLIGIGGHWGRFSNDRDLGDGLAGESQISTEIFYRFQFSQNLAITPSIQYIDNPLLSANSDGSETIFGVRARFVY